MFNGQSQVNWVFETMALDLYPEECLEKSLASHESSIAVAKCKLDDLKGICLGLDVSSLNLHVARNSDFDARLCELLIFPWEFRRRKSSTI